MILSPSEIQFYIPQRYPFIMVDHLLEASSGHFTTDFTISPDNIFVEEGFLREFALIENIAQSCAAGLAYTRKEHSRAKPDGYIGALSKLKLYDLPEVGETIVTRVELLYQYEHMFLLKGENYDKKKKLLECELKVVGM